MATTKTQERSAFVKAEAEKLASAVAQWRTTNNKARREVAEEVGISLQHVRAIEKALASPSFEVLTLLRRMMGLPSFWG